MAAAPLPTSGDLARELCRKMILEDIGVCAELSEMEEKSTPEQLQAYMQIVCTRIFETLITTKLSKAGALAIMHKIKKLQPTEEKKERSPQQAKEEALGKVSRAVAMPPLAAIGAVSTPTKPAVSTGQLPLSAGKKTPPIPIPTSLQSGKGTSYVEPTRSRDSSSLYSPSLDGAAEVVRSGYGDIFELELEEES